VGADGSVPSTQAVEWAADEAARYRRDLHIVHAVENWAFDVPLNAAPGEIRSLSRAGRQILDGAERVAGDRRPEVRVSTGLAAAGTVRALAERSERAFELVVHVWPFPEALDAAPERRRAWSARKSVHGDASSRRTPRCASATPVWR
jgi:Universal stress protein family